MIGRAVRLISSIFLIIALISTHHSRAESKASPEYLVKAAFIYNFAKFVEWPSTVFENASRPLTLCISGDDPFGEALESIKGKTIRERELSIKHRVSIEDLGQCHIIFVDKSENNQSLILNKIKNMHILSISDTEGFVHRGGIISLIKIENKIRFEINIDAAQRAKLTISSKLLNLAEIVRDDSRGNKK